MTAPTSPLRAPRDRLDHAVEHGAPHLRPVWRAVRDHGCEHAIIAQGRTPFALATGKSPVITLVGDDMHQALGPDGFDRPSLVQLVKASSAAAIVSSGPDPRP